MVVNKERKRGRKVVGWNCEKTGLFFPSFLNPAVFRRRAL
jgi:hypothetical protein